METMTIGAIWIPGMLLSLSAIGVMYAEYVKAATLAVSKRKVVSRKPMSTAALVYKPATAK